jgi:uncharacterized protein
VTVITHLPAGGHRRMPWKNGAGTTTEVAVMPPGSGLEDFDWRLAIAELDRSGPFSSFPGIDRLLMMLPGGHVELTIEGVVRAPRPLEVLSFRGEASVSARLVGDAARDINLMLRRGRVAGSMQAVRVEGRQLLAPEGPITALCALEGTVDIGSPGAGATLAPLDCALIEQADELALHSPGGAVLAQISIRPVAG